MKQFKTYSKVFLAMAFIWFTSSTLVAQDKDKSKRPSPPAQVTNTVNGTTITIDYSQPSVKGRTIWGDLVPYGKVWRTGANEATWIEVSADVKIGDNTLPKGKYSMFTIPGEDEWVVIFNSTWDQWGHYNYDESKDVLRVKATPLKSAKFSEQFTIGLSEDGVVNMDWANLSARFDID
ncbi:MAG: DUF2911 domain-containing protein [Marinoscillum sp.]|uniref:DUF2911 domain-containing protein n=1 Tax=Marinoscillum sp. TaxID=2024838 RepID=UPI003305203A